MVVLVVEPAQFKEDFVTVGVVAQSFVQKILRLFHFAKIPQPVSRHRVGVHPLRVQVRRYPQPRQNLTLVAALQMRVLRHHEMPAKALNPILRLVKEVHLPLMFLLLRLAFLGCHVSAALRGLALVENGRVIAAVKRDVGFHEKMVGKKAPPIPQ